MIDADQGDKSTRINEIDPLFLFDLGSFVQAPVRTET